MAITSVGYDGSVNETGWAIMAPRISMPYWVADMDSLKMTVDKDKVLTVDIAPGQFGAGGVMDVSDATESVVFDPIPSGNRYDLIVAQRNWQGGGGVTSFKVIKGGTSRKIPGFARNPGVLDDQLLGLAHIQAGRTTPVSVTDLRGFGLNSRVQLLDALGLEGYKNHPGIQAQIGREEYVLQVDRTWVRTGLISAVTPAYRLYLQKAKVTLKDSPTQGQNTGPGWSVSGDNTMGIEILSDGYMRITKAGTYTISVNVADYFSNHLSSTQKKNVSPGVVKFALLGVWASPSYDIPIGNARYGWEYAFSWTGVLTAGQKVGIGIAQNADNNKKRSFRIQARVEMVA